MSNSNYKLLLARLRGVKQTKENPVYMRKQKTILTIKKTKTYFFYYCLYFLIYYFNGFAV